MSRAFKYRVFLSCGRRDRVWGRRLHAALDSYRTDPDLVGRDAAGGPVPSTLRPVFRSRDGLTAGNALSERTLSALHSSEYLVVLCSREAASSRHVAEEIRRFKAIGRADRLLALIIDGEPGDPERECIPTALRFMFAEGRQPARTWPAAVIADARGGIGERELAIHKVAAGLLGVGLHEVHAYAAQARRWQIRHRRISIAAALVGLLLLSEGGWSLSRHRLATDEALLDRTLGGATEFVGTAVSAGRQLGLPAPLSAQLLSWAEQRLRGAAALHRDTARLTLRRAAMLVELARGYAALGDNPLARTRASEAVGLLHELATDAMAHAGRGPALAATYAGLSEVLIAQGRFEEALAGAHASHAIMLRFAAAEPGNAGRQRDLALSNLHLGDVQLAQGALEEALASFRISLAIGERLAGEDRRNADWRHAAWQAQQRIGGVLRAQGEIEAALASYRASRGIAERLVAGDPGHVKWQRALLRSHGKVGDVLALSGTAEEALSSYRAGYAIAEGLAAADAGDAVRQSDLGASHERVGVMLETRGELDAALEQYGASLAIAGRLAVADPGNAVRQRELAIAHGHIGDILRARGDLVRARIAYVSMKEIIGRLAAADPDHIGWQYELGIAHASVGFVLEVEGDYAAAAREYEACLDIVARFAAAEPGHAGAQHDLAISHGKLAASYHRLGKVSIALAELRKGRAVMAALADAADDAPGSAQWRAELARFDGRIDALEGRGGPPASSLALASAADFSGRKRFGRIPAGNAGSKE